MTVWEFQAVTSGYSEAHGGKSAKGAADISDDRLKELGIAGF